MNQHAHNGRVDGDNSMKNYKNVSRRDVTKQIDGHSETAEGETILVRGCVLDTDGQPIDAVLVDIR